MDAKQEFIEKFELSLLTNFSPEQIKLISNNLYISLQEYDIVKSCTDLIPYDYSNEILMNNFSGCLLIAGKSPKTVKAYVSELKRLIAFKGKNLREINSTDLKEYMAYNLAIKKVSKTTANNIKNYISSFYNWCKEEEIVDLNPCSTLKSVKQEKKLKEVFSEVEIDRMRSLPLHPRDRALIEFMLSTGARIEEICALNVTDIDLINLTVHIKNGKGGKDRIAYMNKVTAYHLSQYLNTRNSIHEALFLNYPNRENKYQKRLSEDGVRNMLHEIGKKLGIPKCHPHKFRRTLATNLYKKGMDLHEIQKILGHENISVTMEYIVADNTLTKHSYNKYMN